ANPLQVVVRSLIFGFDGQCQRFNRAQVEIGHLFHVALFVFELAEIETIRTENEVNGREKKQRSLPVESAVKPGDDSGNSGADQVVGKGPEVAIHQNLPQRPPLGQRNYGSNNARIGEKIDRCSRSQQECVAAHQLHEELVVINHIGGGGGDCSCTNIETDLRAAGALGIKALRQHGNCTQGESLGKAELEHAYQNEEEVDRQRAGYTRKIDFKARGQNGDSEITDKLRNILAGGMNRCIDERGRPQDDDEADESFGAERQRSPRTGAAGHTYTDARSTGHIFVRTRISVISTVPAKIFRNNGLGNSPQTS